MYWGGELTFVTKCSILDVGGFLNPDMHELHYKNNLIQVADERRKIAMVNMILKILFLRFNISHQRCSLSVKFNMN